MLPILLEVVEDPAAISRTAAIVAGRVAQGKQPVVVVSALAKVTDQLLRAAAAAAAGDRTGALAISSRLRGPGGGGGIGLRVQKPLTPLTVRIH